MLIEGCLPVMLLLMILSCRQNLVRADQENFVSNGRAGGPLFEDFEPDMYDYEDKRALDYGHSRFGKRTLSRPAGETPGERTDAKRMPDYGMMKFGRRSPDYGMMKFGRRSPDYGFMKFGKRRAAPSAGRS